MTRPPRLRAGIPLWLARAGTAPKRYPSLRGGAAADVVVVGGGITGSLVALALAEAGASVRLLESAHVGRQSTAASTALLLQEPDQGLTQLSARYGPAAGRRICELSGDAARSFVRTIRRHDVECDLVERDTIYYTTDSKRAELLRSELDRRHATGLPGEWLGPGELRRLTAIPGRGAMRTVGGATLDPYRACIGLLEAATRAGASLHERSPVKRIQRVRNGVRVSTPRGWVDADRVIIATGYATPFLMPLHRHFGMVHTYVVGTRPLSAAERREVGVADVLLWDMAQPYHYARWTPDNRLLFGGADRPMAKGNRRAALFRKATHELREHFARLLPALFDIEFEHEWEGLFALTKDGLPYIGAHRSYPRHLFALGYGGNGMTFAALAARMLVEQWQGEKTPDHELFSFSRG